MGAMSNDPAKLAYFSGFCTPSLIFHIQNIHTVALSFADKAIQSAGNAGIWAADAAKIP